MHLFNTISRTIEPFTPIFSDNVVRIYACGPTVYNYAHIGNLRTYINEDTLKRTLEFNGWKIKHVMNITDVGHLVSDEDSGDDKMELGASREGLNIWEMAQKYTDAFIRDIGDLNILLPTIWCKATDHIQEQIELIQKLESLGLTYQIADGIYYDTAKFSDYGALGGQSLEELKAGARVQLAEGKRNITDFALWKFSPADKKRLMEWESPWGRGFPGWHIECSAMAMKYLGEQIDIHCGGVDHIKVHHTNEIAQVEPVTKKRWVNFWFHPEFLIEKEKDGGEGKMSKSKGEFLTLSLLKSKGYHPLDYRFYALGSHYRSKLSFSYPALDGAKQGRQNLIKLVSEIAIEAGNSSTICDQEKLSELEAKMKEIINNDLNTPLLMAFIWNTFKNSDIDAPTKLASTKIVDQLTGLSLIESYQKLLQENQNIPPEVVELANERVNAKKQKDFKRADELRDQVKKCGYKIVDDKSGYKIEKL
ncbi:MAG: cysteine--tRNA ligase [Oligoflexia bacterium]|nr:cysteine--tRNA ligase [Oligoflexia bacterium]MBF0365795.1 cysteine--tRNA ligase [Oligoflexia bacterium]